mmetsp:Transcript_12286/g.17724  ORF Transcript_12286/g.17724 Transcript_12286/m.17724 type:complete len:287 (+) Transcript_12286:73-933(+)
MGLLRSATRIVGQLIGGGGGGGSLGFPQVHAMLQTQVANVPGAVQFANTPGAVQFANTPGVVQVEVANTPGSVQVANTPNSVQVANREGVVQVAHNLRGDFSGHFNLNEAIHAVALYGLFFAVGYVLVTKLPADLETGKVRLIDVVLGLFLIVSLVSIFRLYQYINKRHEQADSDVCRMFSAMQQTIQGPNPPAWFVRLIAVNYVDKTKSYEVPLWIRGANIIRNNLTWGQATVEMDGTEAFLRLPGIHPSRIPLKHGAVSCKPFSSNANWYLIATVTAWPVVPDF